MSRKKITRREFLGKTAVGITGAAVGMSAKSYSRTLGSNARLSIGLIGCGARGNGHIRMVFNSSKDMNAEMTAVCDIWDYNKERAARYVEKKFGKEPRKFKYLEDILNLPDLDGVMIATGDHQHAKLLVEVVKAGKDCYCEKPMANTLEDAKLARDTVVNSKQIVQIGTQHRSEPFQLAVRDIIRSGVIGKVSKIEQVWNYYGHRWREPEDSDIKRISEEETDWNRWLLERKYRPFDPKVYFEFRIYKDFSSGIADQWMSHGSDLVHLYMDEEFPIDICASGGIYAWQDGRENPDTFQALATYPKGFLYSFATSFGNGYGSYTRIYGKNGTLISIGGEGSPRWKITPEGGGGPEELKEERYVTVPGFAEIQPTHISDDSKVHMDNWLECMRTRKQPNATVHHGFSHSVVVIMAAQAYWKKKTLFWDRKNEQILEY